MPQGIIDQAYKKTQAVDCRPEESDRNGLTQLPIVAMPLARPVPAAKPFPFDALGPILQPAAERLYEVVQAPDAICGQSILAAANLAVQDGTDVEIDGRIYPTSEFYLSVADSGERKSATDKYALKAARQHEQVLYTEYAREFGTFKNQHECYQSERNQILKSKAKRNGKKSQIDALGDEPVPPVSPNVLMEEPTYEGIVKAYVNGQRAVGLFSEEGGRFIGGHAMNSDNLLKTIAGLCGLWDGSPISRVRAGDGVMKLFDRRLTMHLMVQPTVAHLLLGNEMASGQGFLSRCLIVCPEGKAGFREYMNVDLARDKSLILFSDKSLEWLVSKEQRTALKPSRTAHSAWVDFYWELELQMRAEGNYAEIKGLASKAAEHAARLSAILQRFSQPFGDKSNVEINDVNMKRAVVLVQHYLFEAVRLNQIGASDAFLELCEKCLDWLQRRQSDHFTTTELYQKGPRAVRSVSRARQVIHALMEHGHVRAGDLSGSYQLIARNSSTQCG